VWLALTTIYIVWGSTYLAIRVADRTLPPFLMAAVRFLVAGAILYVWAIRRGDRGGDRPGGPQWRAALIVGGLLLLGGNGLVVWSEQRIDSGIAALIVATVPIWMAVWAAALGRERPGLRVAAGLALGFGGTALLVTAARSGGGAVDLLGAGGVVMASFLWALGSVLAGRLPLPKRALVATALEMLCGGALLTVVGVASGELGRVHPSTISSESLLAMGYLIVFGSLVAFSAYVYALSQASTSLVSTYAYVNPVIAVFLGWALLSERVTPLMLLAAAIIVGAVVLIVRGQAGGAREARLVAEASSPANAPAVVD